MNKKRKKAIAKSMEQIRDICEEIAVIQEEEQEYFDNMPENLQGSERGMESESVIDVLANTIGDLESVAETLEAIAEE